MIEDARATIQLDIEMEKGMPRDRKQVARSHSLTGNLLCVEFHKLAHHRDEAWPGAVSSMKNVVQYVRLAKV